MSKTHSGSLGYQMEKALSAIFHPGRSKHLDKRYGRQRGTIYSIETMRNMSANVHQFGRFVKDNWPEVRRVEQITPGMAQAYIDELVRRERSGGWIGRVCATLRGLASGSDGFEEWARLQVGARLPLDIRPPAWYRTLPQLPPARGSSLLALPFRLTLARRTPPWCALFWQASALLVVILASC